MRRYTFSKAIKIQLKFKNFPRTLQKKKITLIKKKITMLLLLLFLFQKFQKDYYTSEDRQVNLNAITNRPA